jgi:hypothetical protein
MDAGTGENDRLADVDEGAGLHRGRVLRNLASIDPAIARIERQHTVGEIRSDQRRLRPAQGPDEVIEFRVYRGQMTVTLRDNDRLNVDGTSWGRGTTVAGFLYGGLPEHHRAPDRHPDGSRPRTARQHG